MNANSGYSGWSMSVRACEAYADGEMPLSKWTKKAMLSGITKCYGNDLAEAVSGWSLASLKRVFLTCSSWHHTSKFFNKTDFYSINQERVWKEKDIWQQHEKKNSCFLPAVPSVQEKKDWEIEACWEEYNGTNQKDILWQEHRQQEQREQSIFNYNEREEIFLEHVRANNAFLFSIAENILTSENGKVIYNENAEEYSFYKKEEAGTVTVMQYGFIQDIFYIMDDIMNIPYKKVRKFLHELLTEFFNVNAQNCRFWLCMASSYELCDPYEVCDNNLQESIEIIINEYEKEVLEDE